MWPPCALWSRRAERWSCRGSSPPGGSDPPTCGNCSVDLRLAGHDGILEFAIRDDGCGFDPTTAGRGAGTQNMSDRVEALEGRLVVVSALGEGTTVTGRIPATPV